MYVRALCLVLGLLAGSPAAAGWQVLNRVIVEHGGLTIDHSKTVDQITAAQAQGGFKADHGVGLFQNRIKTELAFGEAVGAGRRMNLTTRIATAPVIYVARELVKDSCAYKLVLEHELKHQDYDLEVLRTLPDEIHRFSQDVFASDELDRAGSTDPRQFQTRMRSRFFQQFNFVYQALSQMRHPVIDSPDAYRRLSGLCNGELGRLLQNPAKNARTSVGKVAK